MNFISIQKGISNSKSDVMKSENHHINEDSVNLNITNIAKDKSKLSPGGINEKRSLINEFNNQNNQRNQRNSRISKSEKDVYPSFQLKVTKKTSDAVDGMVAMLSALYCKILIVIG